MTVAFRKLLMSVFLRDAQRHLTEIEWAIAVRAERLAADAASELARKCGYVEQRDIAATCALLGHAVEQKSWREARLIASELMVCFGDLAMVHGSSRSGAVTGQA